MRLFGFEVTLRKAPVAAAVTRRRYGFGGVLESFAGAWQRGVVVDDRETILAFSAVYACITLIADDISKLRIKLMAKDEAIWQETSSAAFSPVLKKPNHYQTRIQFLSAWITSKLLDGNTFVLKERDNRGVVVALHILNPRMVTVLVATSGDVFYQLNRDDLTGLSSPITVPATEIIHDRAICFFHPLIGVGPIFACGASATQGNRIQANSAKFFENMSRPSGHLTAPDLISDETAERLKREFEANFSGSNIGRLLVTGDDLKYEAMTIPAEQAQLIEQQRWTVEDVARCFHVPLHKIGAATTVKFSNMAEMNQDYYSQTLQNLIECIELLLDEGLGLAKEGTQVLGVELDLEGLLRMDPMQRAERNKIGLDSGYMAPDEARATDNLPPVPGGAGKEPWMQQQKFPLSVLAKQPPPGSVAPAAPVAPALPAPELAADASKAIVATIEALARRIEESTAEHKSIAEEESAARAGESEMVKALAQELRLEMAELFKRVEPEADEAPDVHDLAAAVIARFTREAHAAGTAEPA